MSIQKHPWKISDSTYRMNTKNDTFSGLWKKSAWSMFEFKLLIHHSKVDLDVKMLFGNITHVYDPTIGKMSARCFYGSSNSTLHAGPLFVWHRNLMSMQLSVSQNLIQFLLLVYHLSPINQSPINHPSINHLSINHVSINHLSINHLSINQSIDQKNQLIITKNKKYNGCVKNVCAFAVCGIKSLGPIFKTEILIYQLTANLDGKLLFGKFPHHLDLEIRKMLVDGKFGYKVFTSHSGP